jgi:hypothetical protein
LPEHWLRKGRVAELAYTVTLASSPFSDKMFYVLQGYELAHTGNGHVRWMFDRIQDNIHMGEVLRQKYQFRQFSTKSLPFKKETS